MASNAEFSRLCGSLSQKTQKIRSNNEQIRNMLGRLSVRADSDELMEKLQSRQHETIKLATDAASMLSKIDQMARDEDDRSKRAQVERLREDVFRVTNDFQSAQRDLARKEKEFLSEARSGHHRLSGAAPASTNAVLIDMGLTGDLGLGPGSPSSGQATEASMQAQIQAQAEIEEIEERERAMESLENDIVHVNEIFRDLGLLVHDQGDAVESIAYNIETAHVEVKEGERNLQKAVVSKRAVRRKKVIIAIIVLVALGILAVIIYFAAR